MRSLAATLVLEQGKRVYLRPEPRLFIPGLLYHLPDEVLGLHREHAVEVVARRILCASLSQPPLAGKDLHPGRVEAEHLGGFLEGEAATLVILWLCFRHLLPPISRTSYASRTEASFIVPILPAPLSVFEPVLVLLAVGHGGSPKVPGLSIQLLVGDRSCTSKVGFVQVGTSKVDPIAGGISQVCSVEVGFAKVDIGQVGIAQVGFAQVGKVQVGKV